MRPSEIRKIAFVGDYLPRKCGIATFTGDMYASLASRFPDAECFVVPVNDRIEGYDYPSEVRFEIDEPDLESYRRAADFLNFANTDVVCLQHEYGIYGGTAGSDPFTDPQLEQLCIAVVRKLFYNEFGRTSERMGAWSKTYDPATQDRYIESALSLYRRNAI